MATVRPGRHADGPRLHSIQAAALAEPWPELLDLALEGGPILRVVATDEPVGYAVAITADAPLSYVPELAVDPAVQGQGHGTALLKDLCETLAERGVERVRLTAREADDAARRFYTDRDFVVVERVPGQFESGAGLVLERELAEEPE
jgi:ribosomal protein S18 acetylase RimI-like enzyme